MPTQSTSSNDQYRVLAVPNISEGRDDDSILAVCSSPLLLDLDADADHNRTVATYEGLSEVLVGELAELCIRARAAIDLTTHSGVHPRFGEVDVVPFVGEGASATRCASSLLEALRNRGLDAEGYGFGSTSDLVQLRRKLTQDGRMSVVAVGVRPPLIAFNVNVKVTMSEARDVVRTLRRPALRALAFDLPQRSTRQISMNLVDLATIGPMAAFDLVRALIGRGEIESAEIVGLIDECYAPECCGLPLMREVRTLQQARVEGFRALRRTG